MPSPCVRDAKPHFDSRAYVARLRTFGRRIGVVAPRMPSSRGPREGRAVRVISRCSLSGVIEASENAPAAEVTTMPNADAVPNVIEIARSKISAGKQDWLA